MSGPCLGFDGPTEDAMRLCCALFGGESPEFMAVGAVSRVAEGGTVGLPFGEMRRADDLGMVAGRFVMRWMTGGPEPGDGGTVRTGPHRGAAPTAPLHLGENTPQGVRGMRNPPSGRATPAHRLIFAVACRKPARTGTGDRT